VIENSVLETCYLHRSDKLAILALLYERMLRYKLRMIGCFLDDVQSYRSDVGCHEFLKKIVLVSIE